MNLREAMQRLKAHEQEFRRFGVQRLYVFGSVARGEHTADLDVDLFFDYKRGKFGLHEYMDVTDYARMVLDHSTDVVTRDSLHQMLRPRIEDTAVRVF